MLSFNINANTLVLIGGGDRPKEALFAFLAAAKIGPIFVLPWGTDYPEESFSIIKSELQKLGASDIRCFCQEQFDAKDFSALSSAGGIYFPGGDQNKIMQRILKNKLKVLIRELYEKGVPIAGTSAGTAIQSNPMLTGFESETSEGLGLFDHFIVDQHFLVRNREGRLITALQQFPKHNGLGIDESMSVVVENSKKITALGPSVVCLYLRKKNNLKKIKLTNLQKIEL